MAKRLGAQTLMMGQPVGVAAWASIAGKKEKQGPLGSLFDRVFEDTMCGQQTWEQAEVHMQKCAVLSAANKLKLPLEALQLLFAGDLVNQCTASSYASRGTELPYAGLYGACSTMAEGLAMAACMVDGGFVDRACAAASSHFCTAERQYRFPLDYGGQRTSTAQWTATAAGACILTREPAEVVITQACFGRVVDLGVTDVNNMGAAMAPAAYDTISHVLEDTKTAPTDYDAIVTGDLGVIGSNLLLSLFDRDGIDLSEVHQDCGKLLYGPKQDTHAGGSGCGCSAAVLCASLLEKVKTGEYTRILFGGTGALMSPTSVQQGESIPGICHAVVLEHRGA
ncbi:MAG: stage V sporulation protein AD [Butyricicoccaceae bacterium]